VYAGLNLFLPARCGSTPRSVARLVTRRPKSRGSIDPGDPLMRSRRAGLAWEARRGNGTGIKVLVLVHHEMCARSSEVPVGGRQISRLRPLVRPMQAAPPVGLASGATREAAPAGGTVGQVCQGDHGNPRSVRPDPLRLVRSAAGRLRPQDCRPLRGAARCRRRPNPAGPAAPGDRPVPCQGRGAGGALGRQDPHAIWRQREPSARRTSTSPQSASTSSAASTTTRRRGGGAPSGWSLPRPARASRVGRSRPTARGRLTSLAPHRPMGGGVACPAVASRIGCQPGLTPKVDPMGTMEFAHGTGGQTRWSGRAARDSNPQPPDP
jgi:hypothetical protein